MPQDNDYNITNLNYYRNLFRNQKEKKQELQPGHNKQEKAWHNEGTNQKIRNNR